MRPHMAHIAQTLARKDAVREAGNTQSSYARYTEMVKKAIENGWLMEDIVVELEGEKERIESDMREGDALFQQGMRATKTSCLNAIELVLSELREEN